MLSPQEIAERTGLSYRSVLRVIEDGELEAFKLRGQLRVPEQVFNDWLEANRVQAGQLTSP